MNRLVSILLVACTLGFMGASPAGADGGVSSADGLRARAVVQAQLDAFAADDAALAFSYAAPSLREAFGSAERFIALVRGSYAVVYRPAAVAFAAPEMAGDEIVQRVHFTDAAGSLWLATYRLQRQLDNNWRIGGCELVQSRSQAT